MSTRSVTILFVFLLLAIAGFWLGFVLGLIKLHSDNVPNNQLLMVQIDDVGDGDAAYISAPGGLSILVDSGSDETAAAHVLAEMHRLSRGAPNILILTNTSDGSIGGVPYLLKHMHFRGPIILPCSKAEFATKAGFGGQAILDAASAQHLPVFSVAQLKNDPEISKFLTASTSDTACQVTLIPINLTASQSSSYALRVDYNEGSLLYTAGLSASDEDQLIAQRVNLNCDVLSSASGSEDNALSSEFLALSQPSVVTLSCSQESPPSDDVLGRLHAADVKIGRTDIAGAITLGISADPSIDPRFFGPNAVLPRQNLN